MPAGEADLRDLLAEMDDLRQDVMAQCFILNEVLARTRPDPDNWSPLEIVAHLAESERYYIAQALRIVTEDNPELAPFDPETHGELIFMVDGLTVNDVVAELVASRAETQEQLAALSDDDLRRTGRHVRWGQPTVVDVVLRLRNHDRTHLAQLIAAIDAAQHQSA